MLPVEKINVIVVTASLSKIFRYHDHKKVPNCGQYRDLETKMREK